MTSINLDRRIAVVLRAPVTRIDHRAIIDLGYRAHHTKDDHIIYESSFTVPDKEAEIAAAEDLRAADVVMKEAYVYTRKSQVMVGGKK